ncbi:MAG: hypothetical protein DKM50_10075 [Candidatus Margulisiibacteriota bacterium]|nr:MAG: hypothetical protein A2X43_04160 [Candidatus Margulisbacteria bacterium GWD2_39_127]OGI05194.1 MAG: hypothetical protein A2X42_02670 [Candidatus Margulisbacteria bacterium GWF2_38_17]OGI06243.1 MAG: hypothetical protein A2X41_08250 [Candidatus Margulisbacteria bacterium GWE2_39_32]PZM78900.1 MAG: hypothetical protein DKM50_10075 [Candidatus Margulisiibacteriota bacterium]HAR64518.1 hypothetical protein [Candidatus Margulisiibacteriota bacterium]
MDITSVGSATTSTEDSRKTKDSLGKDDFLQLLVTQLRYQDPSAPMDNQQMIAQLSQFTSLEQMKNVALATEGVQAFSMIGKYIQAETENSETHETIITSGSVVMIAKQAGKYYATVDTGYELDESGNPLAMKIPEAAFSDVVRDTAFKSEDIWNELKNKGYLDNNGRITSKFQPNAENFVLDIDSRYADYGKKISDVLKNAHLKTVEVEDVVTVSNYQA